MLNYSRSVEIIAAPDVLVCGIGCAGIAAAVGAARMGAATMGVEKWPFAGGTYTASNVNGCCGLADMSSGEICVGGVALELLDRTGALKLPLESRKLFHPISSTSANDGDRKIAKFHTKIPFTWDMEKLKVAADRIMLESGVDYLYHTQIIDVVTSGRTVECVLIANKSGVHAIKPKIVIDCTGDADIAAWAGAPCVMDGEPQAGTLEFYAGNVAVPESKQEIQDKCAAVLRKARENGRIGIYGGPFLSFPAPNVLRFNVTRLPVNGVSARDLTRVEAKGRDDAWRMYELWREELPEFKDSYFLTSGPAVGIRETRRIVGEYTLTIDDINETRGFDDAIVKGGWYIDKHPADSPGYHPVVPIKAYDIPYRTLLPQNVDNLIVAGRCHSATSEALSSSRVGITSMGMGHAAGVAAALSAGAGISPGRVDVNELRDNLIKQGAIL